MTVLVFPKISKNGVIKSEYVESYNRQLSNEDVKTMISLSEQESFQELIDGFNVRKITVSSELIDKLVHTLIQKRNLEMFQFIYKRLSYDDRAKSLWSINFEVDPTMKSHLRHCIDKFDDDYETEFKRLLKLNFI